MRRTLILHILPNPCIIILPPLALLPLLLSPPTARATTAKAIKQARAALPQEKQDDENHKHGRTDGNVLAELIPGPRLGCARLHVHRLALGHDGVLVKQRPRPLLPMLPRERSRDGPPGRLVVVEREGEVRRRSRDGRIHLRPGIGAQRLLRERRRARLDRIVGVGARRAAVVKGRDVDEVVPKVVVRGERVCQRAVELECVAGFLLVEGPDLRGLEVVVAGFEVYKGFVGGQGAVFFEDGASEVEVVWVLIAVGLARDVAAGLGANAEEHVCYFL